MKQDLTRPFATVGIAAVALAFGTGCAGRHSPNLRQAQAFERFPLYWLGDEFEGWKLSAIVGLDYEAATITFIYGNCKPRAGNEGCAPPLQLQESAFCGDPTPAAILRSRHRRIIRGSPIEMEADGAPIMLTRRVQIKVYSGEGADRQTLFRALNSLRSLNHVRPVISATANIPPPTPRCTEPESQPILAPGQIP